MSIKFDFQGAHAPKLNICPALFRTRVIARLYVPRVEQLNVHWLLCFILTPGKRFVFRQGAIWFGTLGIRRRSGVCLVP